MPTLIRKVARVDSNATESLSAEILRRAESVPLEHDYRLRDAKFRRDVEKFISKAPSLLKAVKKSAYEKEKSGNPYVYNMDRILERILGSVEARNFHMALVDLEVLSKR